MALNIAQRNIMLGLADQVTEEKIEEYMTAMSLIRSDDGTSDFKPVKYSTSLKVYVHPDHRQLMNDFCQITGESVSHMIRRLTLAHIKAEIEKQQVT